MYTALVLRLLLSSAAPIHGLNYSDLLQDFPLVVAGDTPDAELTEELSSFVSDGGVRRGRGESGEARRYHRYILKEERVYKDKTMDLMKQVLYAAQEHMGELAPVLDKYRGDPGFRMKFIFNKLQQYIVDMRRIYTLAVKGGVGVKVSDHVRLYQHLARKHIDVIYVVDHVIAAHELYMETLLQLRVDQQKDHKPPVDEAERSPDMDMLKALAQSRGEEIPSGMLPGDMPPGGMPPGGMPPGGMPPGGMPPGGMPPGGKDL